VKKSVSLSRSLFPKSCPVPAHLPTKLDRSSNGCCGPQSVPSLCSNQATPSTGPSTSRNEEGERGWENSTYVFVSHDRGCLICRLRRVVVNRGGRDGRERVVRFVRLTLVWATLRDSNELGQIFDCRVLALHPSSHVTFMTRQKWVHKTAYIIVWVTFTSP
jgi:hypothetical protein